ncbi:serine hydrolase [Blastomonas sp.]|uniref:serine hydrolase domain-containing protein n=1 Tax=Blastomonas sp. TaxID=1909299 RepID=UPI002605F5D1|nr:serine hydrolase [Blastomonas sp.]MDM7956420.1 serine hydrolase [Blastomonas sp.]
MPFKPRLLLAAAFAFIATPALAQPAPTPEPTRMDRAQAAGYKAQFVCSGLWNGNKTLADIEADELTGIYPHIAAIMPTLKADIDEPAHQVSVAFADDMPPRVARHNPVTGCTAMPIAWTNDGRRLPAESLERAQPGSADAANWPMGDSNASDPRIMMITPFDTLVESTFDAKAFGGKTSGVVIVHKGRIVQERYKPGHDMHTAQRTWSVAKSIAGTYVGYVRQKGFAIPDRPVREWNVEGDPRRAITVDHLLRMGSGLVSDTAGNRTDAVYMAAGDVRQWTTLWLMLHQPGASFRYSNNDILLATFAARDAAPEIHPHQMFDALGMTRTWAETDWQGNYILSSQVWTTARDMARMGLLYLNDGTWGGTRVLPEGWRDYVTTPSGPQPEGNPFGYGASFWLMNKSEGAPADAFAALGNRGQHLVIIPSRDLVIVRRGYDSAGDPFDIAKFTAEVLKLIR